MSINYNDVQTGELQKWDTVGTVVEGVLVNYEKKNTANGIGHVYEVRVKDGIVPFFAPVLLQKKLSTVPRGSIVRIEYLKDGKTNSGNTLKHFDVKFAPATDANLKMLGIELMNTVAVPDGDDDEIPFDPEPAA